MSTKTQKMHMFSYVRKKRRLIQEEYRTPPFREQKGVTYSNLEFLFHLETLKHLQDFVDKVANVSTVLK